MPECVKSIYNYDNVFINRLIVVDSGNTDGIIEFLERMPGVEIIDDSKGSRTTARRRGVEAVETEWHPNVDSDVILYKDF